MKRGLVLMIISLLGLIIMNKFRKDDKESFNKEGVTISSRYGRMMRDIFRVPLFIFTFFIGLFLVYNELAANFGWPIIIEFCLSEL